MYNKVKEIYSNLKYQISKILRRGFVKGDNFHTTIETSEDMLN